MIDSSFLSCAFRFSVLSRTEVCGGFRLITEGIALKERAIAMRVPGPRIRARHRRGQAENLIASREQRKVVRQADLRCSAGGMEVFVPIEGTGDE